MVVYLPTGILKKFNGSSFNFISGRGSGQITESILTADFGKPLLIFLSLIMLLLNKQILCKLSDLFRKKK